MSGHYNVGENNPNFGKKHPRLNKGKNHPRFGENKYHITKKFLIKEYSKNKKSQERISKEIECSQGLISNYLKKFNISIETRVVCKISKFFLIKEYIKNEKSQAKIANELKCSTTFIKNRLTKYNIPIRTRSEVNKLFKHKLIGGKTTKKYYCKDCGKEINYSAAIYGKGRCKSCSKKGIRNGLYTNGKSNEPYPLEFNEKLKNEIRKRDNYICQKCGLKEKDCRRKLDIHHIDYDKENCKKYNLISLCNECNCNVNNNRNYWYAYFTYILEE